ncbi:MULTISPECIES: ATP-grasp domain-containing protein [unclassified Colwellia]|uniref:ATP-grasp domain-containing protein n=1 Tax=unclassified Colwellia TaxID=196834 RepID=UPI0015F628ED|nr:MULTISPECIES: ATP-grasp domain-containing protein [unclassified Colwellia]MBA6233483.1 ATP-grasp domain-containing protein [Colwellia sp. MB02u-7]MBA6236573.1 ATP-grasp domain-containing protein [Colwellia sp. MB02u-11]MBA6298028.1 ATP-grasp domain-containing protein [Colwellia sp. MB3u-22]MBA6312148.1 ATP-grasp domain-containing protein [Colwellia sp. MB3u-64]
MYKYRVLVFPGGTEIGLEINRSLRNCKDVQLFSASSGVPNHAEMVFINHSVIPSVEDKDECLTELDTLIELNSITHIIPANPFVIDFLNKYRERIKTKICLVDEKVIDICRSKTLTYSRFKDLLACPITYSNMEESDLPLFVKPDSGYGAQGTFKVKSQAELSNVKFGSKIVASEFLQGEEYSIDCLSDYNGNLQYSFARVRERVRMGTSMRSYAASEKVQKIALEFAEIISKELKMVGSWFFQFKDNGHGVLKLLEIEPRIGGTSALSRAKGINAAYLTLRAFDGQPNQTLINENTVIIERCLKNRYITDLTYDTVYVDLDDTIVIKDKINTELIAFLFQCYNNKIKVILISKSLAEDKIGFLQKYRILELFDELIWLKEEQFKSNFIKHENAIFIDDSFSQRVEVSNKCGIQTFDPSMVELLLDDKGF